MFYVAWEKKFFKILHFNNTEDFQSPKYYFASGKELKVVTSVYGYLCYLIVCICGLKFVNTFRVCLHYILN